MKSAFLIFSGLCLGMAGFAVASERIDHFEGEPAETLVQAVENFSTYNMRLASILEQESLTAQDLGEVHKLTYTLENALEKVRQDLAGLADTLEALHVASETADYPGTRAHGEAYLKTARILVP